jgi:hypothetical protein
MRRWSILAAACLLACRGRENPPAQTSTGSAAPVSQHAAGAPTPAPVLLETPDAGPEPTTPADRFAAEPVDSAWKAKTESELHTRLAHMPGGPPQIDCRQASCEVKVQGTQADMAAAIRDLEQLRDTAQSVLLTKPEDTGNGRLALRAYVRFDH